MQGGYGWASHEMGAPMRPELSLPVGSNTKLMTAVAVMQLQVPSCCLRLRGGFGG